MFLNEVARAWNERVMNDKVRDAVLETTRECLLVHGVVYRLNRERVEQLRQRGIVANGRERVGSDGTLSRDIPLSTALRPAFMTLDMETRVRELGYLLQSAIDASEELMRSDAVVQNTIGRTERSERIGIGITPPHQSYAPWVRTDYVWRQTENGPVPVVVDVNLLPGGTFLTDELTLVFEETILPRYTPTGLPLRPYDPSLLNRVVSETVLKWWERRGETERAQRPRLAVVIREDHGLAPDMELWTKALERHGADATIVSPDSITECREGRVNTAVHGWFDGVIRMVRPVTRESFPDERRFTDKNQGVLTLMEAYKKRDLCLFPGFHVYLEDHGWPYVWRSRQWREHYEAALGKAGYQTLCDSLPRTGVIAWAHSISWHILWDDGRTEVLALDALDEKVVKRSDSTGGYGVFMFHNLSRRQQKEAWKFVERNYMTSLVIQEFVRGPKEIYPVFNGKEVRLVKGNMKYSAYYSNGQYMGGNTMMSPNSYKVHGGSETYVVPLYTIID